MSREHHEHVGSLAVLQTAESELRDIVRAYNLDWRLFTLKKSGKGNEPTPFTFALLHVLYEMNGELTNARAERALKGIGINHTLQAANVKIREAQTTTGLKDRQRVLEWIIEHDVKNPEASKKILDVAKKIAKFVPQSLLGEQGVKNYVASNLATAPIANAKREASSRSPK